jgi:hypothetical protein
MSTLPAAEALNETPDRAAPIDAPDAPPLRAGGDSRPRDEESAPAREVQSAGRQSFGRPGDGSDHAGENGNGKAPANGSATPVRLVQTRRKLPVYPIAQTRLMRWYDKIEEFVSRLSVRDTFWHRICSLIWLPYAFFSGIRMREIEANVYAAVLPFTRINRNWYHAMAGGALLANSEIAGGMWVFGTCGGDYTVVCKNLSYTFLRPCLGPAIYKMTPRESLREQLASGGEFNITLDMEVLQQVSTPGEKDKRVGKCEATFHVTPKVLHKQKRARRAGQIWAGKETTGKQSQGNPTPGNLHQDIAENATVSEQAPDSAPSPTAPERTDNAAGRATGGME